MPTGMEIASVASIRDSVQQGLARGRSQMQSALAKGQRGEVAAAAVDQKLAQHQVEAAVKVAQTVDENLATLIDVLA